MTLSPTDPRHSLLVEVVDSARAAGALLSSYYGRLRRQDADHKGGRHRDLVSRADREAEKLLFDRIPVACDGQQTVPLSVHIQHLRFPERAWVSKKCDPHLMMVYARALGASPIPLLGSLATGARSTDRSRQADTLPAC